MISLIVCNKSKEALEELKGNAEKTIGTEHEFVVINNSDNQYDIFQAYNLGVARAKHDCLVFVHEDVLFLTDKWGPILLRLLKQRHIGAVGVAGTNYPDERGVWADVGLPFIKGRLVHQEKGKLFLSTYSEESEDAEAVALDGVFMACRKKVAEEIIFDERNFKGFHFYDVDWSLRVAQKYKVLVTQKILLLHKSYGTKDTDTNYELLRKRFVQKHRGVLPFTNQSLKPDYNNIRFYKEYELKRKDGVC